MISGKMWMGIVLWWELVGMEIGITLWEWEGMGTISHPRTLNRAFCRAIVNDGFWLLVIIICQCYQCTAFMCHHNSFLIYESLVDANAKRWNFVTHVSVLFSMACSLVLGVTGYSTFTGYTQGTLSSSSSSSWSSKPFGISGKALRTCS